MDDHNGAIKFRRWSKQINTCFDGMFVEYKTILLLKIWASVTVNEMNDNSLVPPFLCVSLNYRDISHQGLYRHARLIALPSEENCTQANLSITTSGTESFNIEPLKRLNMQNASWDPP